MRPYVRRIAAASAAAYLLAGWLAAALHSHAPPGHVGTAEAGETCTTCSCGHHHGVEESSPGREAPEGPADGHHHCVVCDFLAKPPAAAAAVVVIDRPQPICEAAELPTPAYAPVSLFESRSRGPPVAA